MMQKVWEYLQSMKDNGPAENYYGICSNFENFFPEWGTLLDVWEDNWRECFQKWSEFSGSVNYPIPGYGSYSPNEAFDESSSSIMWDPDHEYGAARWRLLDHCIEWFKGFEG